MNKFSCKFIKPDAGLVCILIFICLTGFHPSFGQTKKTESGKKQSTGPQSDSSSFFGLDKLLTIQIEMSDEAWKTATPAQPVGRGPVMPPSPQAAPSGSAKSEPKKSKTRQGGFGIEFEYVHGNVEIDGQKFVDAGIRFKGNSSYLASANSLKHPFKFDFDRYVKDGEFRGVTTLNFSNNAMDATQMREALSYEVFRRANIPCSRTAFARLYLTVAGKYEKKYLGLYTMVEQVDEKFLQRHFGNHGGLLLKPEKIPGIQYLGEDWDRYKEFYQPKSGHKGAAAEAARQRLIAFAKLVGNASDQEFQSQISSYLEIDEFLRFIAANALLANLDSFLGPGHNYYLYLNPDSNKFVFIPWDLNQSFGGMFPFGSVEQQSNLSILHPYTGRNRLIERLLADEKIMARYREIVAKCSADAFDSEQLQLQISAIEKLTGEAIKQEPPDAKISMPRRPPMAVAGSPGRMPADLPLRDFIAHRVISVNEQLAGKQLGFLPQNQGPGMMAGRSSLPGELFKALDRDRNNSISQAEFLVGAKSFFEQADQNRDGRMTTEEVTRLLEKLLPPPPPMIGEGGGGAGMFPSPNQPPGEVPGQPVTILPRPPVPRNLLIESIFKRGDANKDGVVTASEWQTIVQDVFSEADSNKDQALSESELIEAFNQYLPPPRGPMMGPGRGAQIKIR